MERSGGRDEGGREPRTARMASLTSARRRLPGKGRLLTAAVVAVAAVIVILAVIGRPRPVPAPPAPSPTPDTVTPVPPTPTPAPSPTPPPTPETVTDSVWVPLDEATPTPTPWPTLPPLPTRRPRRRPTEDWSCLHYTATAHQSVAAWGQVLFDIELENECGRDFEPLEIWFEITGYRDGAVVQSVRGHPFFAVESGHSTHLTIGLPGSLDWYDDVEVRLLPPPPPGGETDGP